MNKQLAYAVLALPLALVSACGGGAAGGSASQMELIEVSNGFGLMLPHQVFKADASGNPTQELVAIRAQKDLIDNVTLSNPVLPVTEWPLGASLPNGDFGNHFIYIEFTQPIQIESVLDPSPGGQASSGLVGPITVLDVDPITGTTTPMQGRAFIGGRTFAGTPSGTPPELELQKWIELDSSGKPVALPINGAFPGLGFPGTQSTFSFPGAIKLTSPNTFVFVVDTDGDLTTHETFPVGHQIRLRASNAVKAKNGKQLSNQVLASATVGPDVVGPEVGLTPPPNSVPITTPSFGDVDVDPQTTIRVQFTEPLQPLTVGALPKANSLPALSSSISISFGPSTALTLVPFTALPVSPYDLSEFELTPALAFPGNGPVFQSCGTFNQVTVTIQQGLIQDLKANVSSLPASTNFITGEGPGLVNAPIVPDVVYAVRQGDKPGVSVIDLNGFGQGTGNPTYDFDFPFTYPKGNTNFPNNPNVRLQGSALVPKLKPGTCTVDGGSEGVFTLTKDSSLNSLLLSPPVITSISDIAVGHPLDRVFNAGNDIATGCSFPAGNQCAVTGKKVIQLAYAFNNPNTNAVPSNIPGLTTAGFANYVPGGGNPVCFAPHPNPPPLVFPPLCVQPYIGGQEPTSYIVIAPPPPAGHGFGFTNLLVPGDPFGDPLGLNSPSPKPPSGLLSTLQNCFFEGPDPPSIPLGTCYEYQQRQQVGHFLYVVDRARREIVVVNSNRFSVIDRIQVPDPTDLAMGPNMDFLAVSNQDANSVSFIDIDPASSNFHNLIKTTPVGNGPRGIAWDPGNEDILVCNELENTVSIISAFDLNVRKTVKSHLNLPFDVAITQRQWQFGYLRNVYFGWILNRNGDLTMFESGPNGVNGWGYDDTIGVAPMNFKKPKRIMVDYYNLGGGVWIAHEDPLDSNGNPTGVKGGAISNAFIYSTNFGQLPLTGGTFGFTNPQFRDMTIKVQVSIGPNQLTGIPFDFAFDDMVNLGGVQNVAPTQAAGTPALLNGKSYVRAGPGGLPVGAKSPRFLLAAVPASSEGPGVVDVINVQSGNLRFDTDPYLPGTQSIPVPGVSAVVDYWRQ
jgi:DNA-binding beta-propeller fold protein YncE